jgi:hypothetical protein
MDDVRTLAIKNLCGILLMLLLKMIYLGRQYDIQDWIFIGVENLVIRTRPLGEEEVTALGISEFLKLASIRESFVGLNPQLDQGPGFTI